MVSRIYNIHVAACGSGVQENNVVRLKGSRCCSCVTLRLISVGRELSSVDTASFDRRANFKLCAKGRLWGLLRTRTGDVSWI